TVPAQPSLRRGRLWKWYDCAGSPFLAAVPACGHSFTLLTLLRQPASPSSPLCGIYNIVDDDPAPVSSWLPELARAAGAKPPYHLPAWIGRLAIGEAGMSMMTQARGSSNAKAKRVLDWKLLYPTWRDGFRRVLAPEAMESAWPSSA